MKSQGRCSCQKLVRPLKGLATRDGNRKERPESFSQPPYSVNPKHLLLIHKGRKTCIHFKQILPKHPSPGFNAPEPCPESCETYSKNDIPSWVYRWFNEDCVIDRPMSPDPWINDIQLGGRALTEPQHSTPFRFGQKTDVDTSTSVGFFSGAVGLCDAKSLTGYTG